MVRALFRDLGRCLFDAGLADVILLGKSFGLSTEAILALGVLFRLAVLFLSSLFEVVVRFSSQRNHSNSSCRGVGARTLGVECGCTQHSPGAGAAARLERGEIGPPLAEFTLRSEATSGLASGMTVGNPWA